MLGTRYGRDELSDEIVAARMRQRISDFVSGCEEQGKPYAIYVNETNGLQALPILFELGIPARFCHVRSTHFESKATSAAIKELPQEMLLSAALGEHILVVDYGACKDRSRAVYQGIPYVKYVLDRAWLGIVPEKVWIRPRSNTRDLLRECAGTFDEWYRELGTKAKKKLRSYQGIACESLMPDGVSITGISEATTHDGDKLYYARIKKEYFDKMARMLDGTRAKGIA